MRNLRKFVPPARFHPLGPCAERREAASPTATAERFFFFNENRGSRKGLVALTSQSEYDRSIARVSSLDQPRANGRAKLRDSGARSALDDVRRASRLARR